MRNDLQNTLWDKKKKQSTTISAMYLIVQLWFSNFSLYQNQLEGSVKTQMAKPYPKSFWLNRSEMEHENLHFHHFLVMLVLLLRDPHFGNRCLHTQCTYTSKNGSFFILFKENQPIIDCPNFTMVGKGQKLPKSKSPT